MSSIGNLKKRVKSAIKGAVTGRPVYDTQGDEEGIINAVFGERKEGFYIDVGAHDPVHYSNTYALYKRGWRGLCFEPNEKLHAKFREVRPGDTLVTAAASNYDGSASFFLGKHSTHSSMAHSDQRHVEKIEVNVRRLDNVMKEMGIARKIDLISVDTEGTELDVFEGLDLSVNRPRLIVVEYNTANVINKELQPYLIGKGYQVLAMTCWNIIATDKMEEDYKVLCPAKKHATRG